MINSVKSFINMSKNCSRFVHRWFKDTETYSIKTNFSSLFFRNLAMTGVVEGTASYVLFNIISGRGGVKGWVCLPIPLYSPRGKGCRGKVYTYRLII